LADLTLLCNPQAGGPTIVIERNQSLGRAEACAFATDLTGYAQTCLALPGVPVDGGFVFDICGNMDGPACGDAGP
jgi:hypothetical protein